MRINKKRLPRAASASSIVAPVPVVKPSRRISDAALAASRSKPSLYGENQAREIEPYQPPKGVIPPSDEKATLALDSTPYDFVNQVYCSDHHFPGYPFLALLTQLPEYRKMSETIAEEMTRKWITFHAVGDDDKSEKIKVIEAALVKYKVRDLFRRAMELDGFYGRGQIYIDVNLPDSKVPARDDPNELNAVLLRDKAKITKGCLNGFKLVEPVWTYPVAYNANDPLRPDYYKPTSWFVMGKRVHSSRLLLFISREVPDLLKASYNFGGLSLSQLAKTYVDNWIRTRDSVSEIVHSFSTSGIKTNMGDVLSGDGATEMNKRAELYNNTRDNRGVLMMDKDSEEFFQFNVPLTGLSDLQAQAQEQMSSVNSIPLVKFLGISPAGLNATSEGEIEVFDDHIMARKRNVMSDPLTDVINIIQLNEFGEIDPDIIHEFDPMAETTEIEQANIRKVNADTDAVLVGAAIIAPDDARERLINDPDSGYTSLEANVDLDDNDDDSINDEPD